MSDVISFRLDKDNPREEKARQVLKAWYEEGHRLRYIMTEALLRLDKPQIDPIEDAVFEEINEKLNRISQLLEQNGNGQPKAVEKDKRESPQSDLTAGFLGMIQHAAKPGLRYDS